jgi:hypothetical protein
LRDAVAAALLARRDHDLLPVRTPVLGALAFGTRDGARRQDRLQFGDAELHRLAHGAIHLFSRRYALHERDAQRRLALERPVLEDVDADVQSLHGSDARRKFAAATVEECDRLAFAQAQYVDRVMRGVFGQRAHPAGAQRRIDVEARRHAAILAWRRAWLGWG